MAFDTSSKHKFSNLPNTFPENPIKPHLRNVFSIGGSSSNLLSHHHSHHLIGNSHFNIEGYSMNPFSGFQNPLLNQYESLHHHSSSEKARKASKTDKKLNAVKRQWTPPEDRLLTQMVQIYGENWSEINQHLNGRTGKQCRERWRNHLRPDIKKGPWTQEEERILIEAQKQIGNKWAEISRSWLPGRAENTIKNQWKAIERRPLSARSCKGPECSLSQNYVNQVLSSSAATDYEPNAYFEPNMSVPNAMNNQQAWQQGRSSQYCAHEQLVPSFYNGVVNASSDTITFRENCGLVNCNSSESCSIVGSLLDKTPTGNSMIAEGAIMGLEIPVDMDPLMQFGMNEDNLSLLEIMANLYL